jgi:DNA-binding NarL/FixJ family response regulator
LIVDDDPLFRLAVAAVVTEDPAVEVMVAEAGDGAAAIASVEAAAPDVVIMDVTMPVLDGIEASRIIGERWPAIRVVIVTGSEQDAGRAQAALPGVDAFIMKTDIVGRQLRDTVFRAA